MTFLGIAQSRGVKCASYQNNGQKLSHVLSFFSNEKAFFLYNMQIFLCSERLKALRGQKERKSESDRETHRKQWSDRASDQRVACSNHRPVKPD